MNKYENIIELIVRLVIKKDDKFLICKSLEHGHNFLPGGHVEFGDTMEKTIYKEIEEELGLGKDDILNISFQKYQENSYEYKGQKHCELNLVFTAELKEGVDIKSQEDHIDFHWIDNEDIKNINLLPEGILEK